MDDAAASSLEAEVGPGRDGLQELQQSCITASSCCLPLHSARQDHVTANYGSVKPVICNAENFRTGSLNVGSREMQYVSCAGACRVLQTIHRKLVVCFFEVVVTKVLQATFLATVALDWREASDKSIDVTRFSYLQG